MSLGRTSLKMYHFKSSKNMAIISIKESLENYKGGDLYRLRTLVDDERNIGRLISWWEDGRWATALMTGVNWFNHAVNLGRDGSMEGEDEDGYYNRIWSTDQFYNNSISAERIARFSTYFEVQKWEEKLRL